MNQDPFQLFLKLINFDQQFIALRKELEQLKMAREKSNNKQIELEKTVESSHNELKAFRMQVDQKEREMQDLDTRIQDKSKKLEHVSSSKEYNSLLQEINQIKSKALPLEEQVLLAWNQLETAKRNHEQQVKNAQTEKESLEAEIKTLDEKITRLLEQLTQLEQQRSTYLVGFPDEWLEKYNAMREKVPDPVVPVYQDSCSACFTSISGRDLAALRKKVLLQCRGCYRFLYVPEVFKEDAQ